MEKYNTKSVNYGMGTPGYHVQFIFGEFTLKGPNTNGPTYEGNPPDQWKQLFKDLLEDWRDGKKEGEVDLSLYA